MKRPTRVLPLIGPALVAGVAYLDPGNIASNMTAGARFGYTLVWVVVVANLMAWLVQYLSAKLGIATGRSLTQHLGERIRSRPLRIGFWAQAELAAMATDVAEIIGGAIALNLLFGLPLVVGGLITAAVSLALLALHSRLGMRAFERAVVSLLVIIACGFLAALVVRGPNWVEVAGSLVPSFAGSESVLLAASIVGATVMPHAIYAHSALVRDRFESSETPKNVLVRATRIDVTVALGTAGLINVAMLLVGAVSLGSLGLQDGGSATTGNSAAPSLGDIYSALNVSLGAVIATLFAVALLASGLASSSVANYAGADIMSGLIRQSIPLWVRRSVTSVPAIVLLAVGINPVWMLVLSQVVLSFAIPFALVPLISLTARTSVMGLLSNRTATTLVAIGAASALIALNVWLLVLLFSAS